MENEPILSLSDILEETASKMVYILAASKLNDESLIIRKCAYSILAHFTTRDIISSVEPIEKITKVFLNQIGVGHYITYRFSDQTGIQCPYVYTSKTTLPETIYKDGDFIEFLISN